MKSLFLTLLMVLSLILLLGTGYMIYEEDAYILQSRANAPNISGSNSLAVTTPSCVKGDGEEITRLTVYCLNARGLGEPDISVSVMPTSVAQTLDIQPIQATTDSFGKAIYDIRSSTPGFYDLTIMCGDVLVKDNHKTCFRN